MRCSVTTKLSGQVQSRQHFIRGLIAPTIRIISDCSLIHTINYVSTPLQAEERTRTSELRDTQQGLGPSLRNQVSLYGDQPH